jgi:hypothetical protein
MEFRHYFMPYCLQRLKDGRYIVLNRQYKPLGHFGGDWVDYESHPSAAKIKITAAAAKAISWNGSESLDVIHLYNDGTIPTTSAEHWRLYSERLKRLAHLKLG